jgi:hypothetical protein
MEYIINAVYFQPQFSEYLNKPKYSRLVFEASMARSLVDGAALFGFSLDLGLENDEGSYLLFLPQMLGASNEHDTASEPQLTVVHATSLFGTLVALQF